ncbi:PHP-associated domain-containing protein [Paenibacillus hexagrammi]|uniref:PHP domain-containing protein n=1 Tax=Paenibacillus hexagrammi TaxID=2908839 RepID=A0ABY3SI15_9BACL|nr:PHP-associated domain-containing protein [Paenibacillus sp. YPD9-1]UJF33030.1 PHP domain-containing protein [Paenibacillus sp. YPD9-1]
MRIDFHIHAKLSKKTEFNAEHFRQIVEEARARGLTAITLTEHFNTHRFDDVYSSLDDLYPYNGHYYLIDGFRVFTGMEVDVAEGGHILVSGPKDRLLDIRSELEPHVSLERFIPLAKLFELCDSPEMMVIGGHPFRESNPLHHVDENLLRRFDAFDLNGKDLHEIGIEANKAKVLGLGQRLNVPVVAGSDAHHLLQAGCVYNEFDQNFETIAELKQAVRAGAFNRVLSPELDLQVRAAQMVKKLLKRTMEVA